MRGNGRLITAAITAGGACLGLTVGLAAAPAAGAGCARVSGGVAAGPRAAAASTDGPARPASATPAAAAATAPVIIFLKSQVARAAAPSGAAGRLAQVRAAQ